jgi:hypothetical protein
VFKLPDGSAKRRLTDTQYLRCSPKAPIFDSGDGKSKVLKINTGKLTHRGGIAWFLCNHRSETRQTVA